MQRDQTVRGGRTFPDAVVKVVVGVTAHGAQPPLEGTPLAPDRGTDAAGAGFVGVCNERSIFAILSECKDVVADAAVPTEKGSCWPWAQPAANMPACLIAPLSSETGSTGNGIAGVSSLWQRKASSESPFSQPRTRKLRCASLPGSGIEPEVASRRAAIPPPFSPKPCAERIPTNKRRAGICGQSENTNHSTRALYPVNAVRSLLAHFFSTSEAKGGDDLLKQNHPRN